LKLRSPYGVRAASGAFRMRGIGSGQTIRVYMIPEVRQLIETHVSRARAEEVGAYHARLAAMQPHAQRQQLLEDVTTWLILSSMKSEKTQFNLSCEHSARNVWRKAAWKVSVATGGWVRQPRNGEEVEGGIAAGLVAQRSINAYSRGKGRRCFRT
jgi:hypothetical protein